MIVSIQNFWDVPRRHHTFQFLTPLKWRIVLITRMIFQERKMVLTSGFRDKLDNTLNFHFPFLKVSVLYVDFYKKNLDHPKVPKPVNQGDSSRISRRTRFFPDMRSSQGLRRRMFLSISQLKSTHQWLKFSWKLEKPPKNVHFLNYWMIQIVSGKSGSVTLLPFLTFNFMPKIMMILWLEVL